MSTLVSRKDHEGDEARRPVTPEEIKKYIEKNNIRVVDFKFNDLPGLWQHFSIPASDLCDYEKVEKSIWTEGIGFDGSSIRGYKKI